MPADQLFVIGHGANHPVVSNASDAGKARNRRIEFVVYPERMAAPLAARRRRLSRSTMRRANPAPAFAAVRLAPQRICRARHSARDLKPPTSQVSSLPP